MPRSTQEYPERIVGRAIRCWPGQARPRCFFVDSAVGFVRAHPVARAANVGASSARTQDYKPKTGTLWFAENDTSKEILVMLMIDVYTRPTLSIPEARLALQCPHSTMQYPDSDQAPAAEANAHPLQAVALPRSALLSTLQPVACVRTTTPAMPCGRRIMQLAQ